MPQLSLNDHLSEVGLDKWFAQLGATPAPIPRANVRAALQFFARHMATLPPTMALNFLRAMDLSRRVRGVTLQPPEEVIAFRVGTESPFKLFYTRPGGSKYASGINPEGRSAVRFRVRAAAPALESYTTGAIDVWTVPGDDQPLTVAPRANAVGFMASGGGLQLIIPRAYERLTVV